MKNINNSLLIGTLFLGLLFMQRNALASTQLLLQVKTFGGFVPMEYAGSESGISVYRNGIMESFYRKNAFTSEQKTYLGQLGPIALNELTRKIEGLSASGLVSDTPEVPECVDTPTTDYTLWKKSGESFVFARQAVCHKYFVKEYLSRWLVTLLEGLELLVPKT
jgi:hypothetical protein